MHPFLLVAAMVSFPKHKALITNFADFSSIFLVPLLVRYAVKNQKNSRQRQRNPEIQPQKHDVKGDIRLSAIEAKDKKNQPQEMATIVNQSTVRYNKRSIERNKNTKESNPDEIVVVSVDEVIDQQ